MPRVNVLASPERRAKANASAWQQNQQARARAMSSSPGRFAAAQPPPRPAPPTPQPTPPSQQNLLGSLAGFGQGQGGGGVTLGLPGAFSTPLSNTVPAPSPTPFRPQFNAQGQMSAGMPGTAPGIPPGMNWQDWIKSGIASQNQIGSPIPGRQIAYDQAGRPVSIPSGPGWPGQQGQVLQLGPPMHTAPPNAPLFQGLLGGGGAPSQGAGGAPFISPGGALQFGGAGAPGGGFGPGGIAGGAGNQAIRQLIEQGLQQRFAQPAGFDMDTARRLMEEEIGGTRRGEEERMREQLARQGLSDSGISLDAMREIGERSQQARAQGLRELLLQGGLLQQQGLGQAIGLGTGYLSSEEERALEALRLALLAGQTGGGMQTHAFI